MTNLYFIEKIKLEDLPDHLKRLGLTAERLELWQKRGWLPWTRKIDDAKRT